MYNPFLKFHKIFIKKGKNLFVWNLIFQIFIVLKLLFHFENKTFQHNFIFQKNKIIKQKLIYYYHLNINFLFYKFFENLKPSMIFISKVVSGKSQNIPYLAQYGKEYTLAFQWFIKIINHYPSATLQFFHECFFLEFLLILQHRGSVFSFREDFYNQILKNRNFLKFLK